MFKLKEHGTNIRTEIFAGITTFFTMAYIIFVNPSILTEVIKDANGNPLTDSVFVATIIATVIGTLIMGLVANVPYAVAPGMGLNAFFTYTVCFAMGFTWQQALAMVFICGIINVLITVTKVRKAIIRAIPRSLQAAIGGAIGLFIAYIGLINSGIVVLPTMAGGVPVISNFAQPAVLLSVIGLVITVVLLVLKVKGAILWGIIATTLIGIPMGITSTQFEPQAHSIASVSQTFWAFDFKGLGDPARILTVIVTVFAFSLTDTFDTIGTFMGTGRRTGIFDEKDEKALQESKGFKSKMDRALFADSTATSIGAIFGTSNTTTYVESAAGIGVGGRTGLTSVVVAILFAACLLLTPVASIVPAAATAPALIIVGILMAEALADIKWNDLEEAIPAFFTVVVMSFSYGISNGIAAGFIFYVLTKVCRGKAKEVHPIIYISAALFIINFIITALVA